MHFKFNFLDMSCMLARLWFSGKGLLTFYLLTGSSSRPTVLSCAVLNGWFGGLE